MDEKCVLWLIPQLYRRLHRYQVAQRRGGEGGWLPILVHLLNNQWATTNGLTPEKSRPCQASPVKQMMDTLGRIINLSRNIQ